ncbi:MAG: glycerate kinase [Clostridia bacterium]|nr:glycerate kinase [Clostridia bacterium]
MIIIAPDSFKGTMTASEVCEIIKNEFLKADPMLDIRCLPIADGGEGTVDALLSGGGERVSVTVNDPYFNKIESFYGIMPDGTAIIEMAAASGLPLVGENKNPLLTTTYGTGELIRAALDRGCTKILLGIGGSATNDAGLGCAAALGVKFTDKSGNEVSLNGKGLSDVYKIDLEGIDSRLKTADIKVLCDVTSPLYGEEGAAYVFAPQKGADECMVELLDKGLRNFSEAVRRTIGKDNSLLEGAGAAGGLGFCLVSLLSAELVKGAPTLLRSMGLDTLAESADLIITGEGCFDEQSLLGKAPSSVAELSGNTPVIAVAGRCKIDLPEDSKIRKVYVTDTVGKPFDVLQRECFDDLAAAARQMAEDYLYCKR